MSDPRRLSANIDPNTGRPSTYAHDIKFEDNTVGHAQQLLSYKGVTVTRASRGLDTKHATDLVRTWDNGSRVEHWGLRSRGGEYVHRYPFDLTLRSARDSGAKTELAKVLEGNCDGILYAFIDPKRPSQFCRWVKLWLPIFRLAARDCADWWHGCESKKRSNRDGTYFVPIDLRAIPSRYARMVQGTSFGYWDGQVIS